MGGAVTHVKKLLKGRGELLSLATVFNVLFGTIFWFWVTLPGGVEKLITMDISHDMIKKSMDLAPSSSKLENHYVVGDEEYLPFKEG